MKYFNIANTDLQPSRIALGCMRMRDGDYARAERIVMTALEQGINFFDHADIYGAGLCEEYFGRFLKEHPGLREKILIQSKCGIHKPYYDFSRDYLLSAVDGILSRLGVDHLDTLLLHRPDALCEPEEVAEVFETLHAAGKVRYFGVSNHNPMQIELLKKYVRQPLVINQLQFSITNATMIDAGLNVNTGRDQAVMRDGSVLDYSRLNDMTVQPWSPFCYGFFEGFFIGSDRYPALNAKLDELAEKYGVTNSAIAIAWILRHPARMQPIVGTMTPGRLEGIAKAADVELTRAEWYEIYKSAGNKLL